MVRFALPRILTSSAAALVLAFGTAVALPAVADPVDDPSADSSSGAVGPINQNDPAGQNGTVGETGTGEKNDEPATGSEETSGLLGDGTANSGGSNPQDPASDSAQPTALTGESVTAPGNWNSQAGCPDEGGDGGNWQPGCENIELAYNDGWGLYAGQWELNPGNYEFKIAVGGSWEINYGAWGEYNSGSNIAFSVPGSTPTAVYFFYDPTTNYAFANVASELYTVAGDFLEDLGGGSWATDWFGSVMFPQSDGSFRFQTRGIGSGNYAAKVVKGQSWDNSWPGSNYDFSNTAGNVVTVTFTPPSTVNITSETPPVQGTGEARAIWLDADTIAWPASISGASAVYALVGHDDVKLTPGTLTAAQKQADKRVANGYIALKVTDTSGAELATDVVQAILRGPLNVTARLSGALVGDTSLQIAGVLDDVYAAAKDSELGITWGDAGPTLSVWAPTAQDVKLLLWDSGATGDPTEVPATRDDTTGVWSVLGDTSWEDKEYLWDVNVFVPSLGAVVSNEVTDPYSIGLTVNSERSVIVNLASGKWMPQDWSSSTGPVLANNSAHTIYELHVRDFSAWDNTVPEEMRGTYKAFTQDSDGTRQLRELSESGITTLHLLPTFDISSGTINEDRSQQITPSAWGIELKPENQSALETAAGGRESLAVSEVPQASIYDVRSQDAFNWGYDPYHWATPEGSYATEGNQNGGYRTLEYREMVKAIHDMDLQVVQDLVFNHTAASGQDSMSVLDKVVPGYYHRLNAEGKIQNSTCCENVATENTMSEKIMVDSIVSSAVNYRIDGFRFDLMGHHSLANMQAIRDALDALTIEKDGVNGKNIYLYGEGWSFGEVAGDALFPQASINNIAGTHIGVFSDRLRDAVLGAHDSGQTGQGFGNGLYTYPNQDSGANSATMMDLFTRQDVVKFGLAGSLKDYELQTVANGAVPVKGKDFYFNGQAAGFASNPEETVNYVEAHDNETLYDNNIWKLPVDADMNTRSRAQVLSNATVAMAQSPAFFTSGTEILRSKSLDRDSYNSGDWANAIDWTMEWNAFGKGLPVAEKNDRVWDKMKPLLAKAELVPNKTYMEQTDAMTKDLFKIRASSPLFSLGTADLIIDRVTFPNSGVVSEPGFIAMLIDDQPETEGGRAVSKIDENYDSILVLFNATPNPIAQNIEGMAGRDMRLHPVQANGSDPVVKETTWNATNARVEVPAWTVAVLVDMPFTGVVVADPASVVAGEDIVIKGSGWVPGESVTVRIPGVGEQLVTADEAGEFTVAFPTEEDLDPGSYSVVATNEFDDAAETEVEVTSPDAPVEFTGVVVADPASVVAGEDIVIKGSGWVPGESVTVSIPGVGEQLVTADEAGEFTVAFPTEEDLDPGSYSVVATNEFDDAAETTVKVTASGSGGEGGEGEEKPGPGEGGEGGEGEEKPGPGEGGEGGEGEEKPGPGTDTETGGTGSLAATGASFLALFGMMGGAALGLGAVAIKRSGQRARR